MSTVTEKEIKKARKTTQAMHDGEAISVNDRRACSCVAWPQSSLTQSVRTALILVLHIHRCLKSYRYVCYLFAVGLDGLCYLCLPLLQTLPLLVPFSCTFGYFDGAYVTLIPVVTAEIVGTSSLSSALGVVYFLHAVPYLVSPPIAGKFPERTPNHLFSLLY